MTNIHPLHTTLEPPTCFTDPFDYQPHPLVIQAADEVKQIIKEHKEWTEDIERGKMFGVLVVKIPENESIGYLAAFSGLLGGEKQADGFVPPIFNALQPRSSHFMTEQACVDKLNEQIAQLAPDDELCKQLKQKRSERSQQLQQWIFNQYKYLNANGETKNTERVFMDFYQQNMLHPEHFARNSQKHSIPSGAGDCCAPKLLQYAYLMHLKPLCIGEWWMGASPIGEIRHQGQFYTACMSKCRPILSFMLQGLALQPGPRKQKELEAAKEIKIIHFTDDYIIINKPTGILSVPGRDNTLSVLDVLCKITPLSYYYPAHRLDQDTSGLLIIARTEQSYAHLQKQFQEHRIEKTYTALLDGEITTDKGIINLPLRPDSNNRPMQMVDIKHGKRATTHYQVIRRFTVSDHSKVTLVKFMPETGRTHQLRIHAAYHDGLNCPIIGDQLYGRRTSPVEYKSLCLHADSIRFTDPSTNKTVEFTSKPPFWEDTENYHK